MSNILIIFIIALLFFGTEKFKEKSRLILTILISITFISYIIVSIVHHSIAPLGITLTDFLLFVVIYILLFGAEKFRVKPKLVLLFIIVLIVVIYTIGIITNTHQINVNLDI